MNKITDFFAGVMLVLLSALLVGCGEGGLKVHEHDFRPVGEIPEASCAGPVLVEYVCEICGEIKTEVVPKSENHKYDRGTCVVCSKPEPNALSYSLIEGKGYAVRAETSFGCKFSGRIEIPETYEGKPVVEIMDGGFTGRDFSDVTEIVIPGSVRKIGRFAFDKCAAKSVIILPGIEVIDKEAFQWSAIGSIVIPDTVTQIEDHAFSGSTGLKKISIPDSVQKIGWAAFSGCAKLEELIIPGSVTKLGSNVAAGCKSLKTISFGEGIKSIDIGVLQNCPALENISLPSGLEEFYCSAEVDLTNVKFTVENGVNYLGNENDPYVVAYSVEETVDPEYPLIELNAKTRIVTDTLLDAIGEIHGGIILPESVVMISVDSTYRNSIIIFYCGDPAAFYSIKRNSIGYSSKYEWFPMNVYFYSEETPKTTTEYWNFIEQDGERRINVGITSYCTHLNYEYDSDKGGYIVTSVYDRCDCEVIRIQTYPNYGDPYPIVGIAPYAFSGKNITGVTIPHTVRYIDDSAFADCASLKTVVIGGGALESIGANAFKGASALESVLIEKAGLKTIGHDAFNYCKELKSINIPSTVTTIERNAFINCRALESIVIPNGVTTIGDSAFSGMTALKSIVVPDSVTSFGTNVFSGNTSLTSVVIGSGVTELRGTFDRCSALVFVKVPDNVTVIGSQTFSQCTALRGVILGSGVTEIGQLAFRQCSSLEYIVMPKSVTEIGSNASSQCNSSVKVYYYGTEAEYKQISGLKDNNNVFLNASVYTYSENAPTDSGLYWYLEDGDPFPW